MTFDFVILTLFQGQERLDRGNPNDIEVHEESFHLSVSELVHELANDVTSQTLFRLSYRSSAMGLTGCCKNVSLPNVYGVYNESVNTKWPHG